MNRIDPPAGESQQCGRPVDDLDGLLRAFFQAEMPRSWPSLELPGQPVRTIALRAPTPSTNGTAAHSKPQARLARFLPAPRFRSRLALAASVGLLLLGTWALSGQFHLNSAAEPDPSKMTASPKVREEIIQSYDELPGPDGKPIHVEKPSLYRIDVYLP